MSQDVADHVAVEVAGKAAGIPARTLRHKVAEAVADTAIVTDAARQQLASIRDEWLAPLVAQITTQADRIGHLEAERDELQRRVEAAEAAVSRQHDGAGQERAQEGSGTPEPATVAQHDAPGVWGRLRRRWRG
jgi:hypothetical protein